MKTTNEILKELLNESRQVEKYLNEHAYDYFLPNASVRAKYATHFYYMALESHRAVVLLTHNELHGPALTLIRPTLESWLRGTWIILVPSDDVIEQVTMDSEFWNENKMTLWKLRNEINQKNEFLGGMMKGVLVSVNSYLNDCVHINNQHLNRYFNKETQSLEMNVPEDEMALMLDLANTLALSSGVHMKALYKQDLDFLRPFIDKMNTYQAYSIDLLRPLIP